MQPNGLIYISLQTRPNCISADIYFNVNNLATTPLTFETARIVSHFRNSLADTDSSIKSNLIFQQRVHPRVTAVAEIPARELKHGHPRDRWGYSPCTIHLPYDVTIFLISILLLTSGNCQSQSTCLYFAIFLSNMSFCNFRSVRHTFSTLGLLSTEKHD